MRRRARVLEAAVEAATPERPLIAESPASWVSSHRTGRSCLPAAANSGHHFATGASRSTTPRSTSMSRAIAASPLVHENVQAMVLGGHGDTMVPLIRYTTVAGRSKFAQRPRI